MRATGLFLMLVLAACADSPVWEPGRRTDSPADAEQASGGTPPVAAVPRIVQLQRACLESLTRSSGLLSREAAVPCDRYLAEAKSHTEIATDRYHRLIKVLLRSRGSKNPHLDD